MSDYISRAAAIKTAIEWYDTHFRDGESVAGLATGLKNLPSADVRENVRSEWTLVTDRYGINGEYVWKCSSCNKMTICKGDFCPNCGADMRGDTNE